MSRYPTVTHKIARSETGLNGSLFVHVEHFVDGRIRRVEFSHKWKDANALDKVFRALGDATTEAVREAQGG